MSPEEYGVLVLSLEDVTGGHGVDGSLTLDLEAVAEAYLVQRRAELEAKRAEMRSDHASAVRAHEQRCREAEQELNAYAERMEAHEKQRRAHELAVRAFEERERAHEDAALRYMQAYSSASSERARRALAPPSPRPEPPGAPPVKPSPPASRAVPAPPARPSLPPIPTDEELMSGFKPDKVRAWTARLTTTVTQDALRGAAVPERIDPPPAFVAAMLNAVAADGWFVHHVAEDRVMVAEDVRLVSVRYLLRRVQ